MSIDPTPTARDWLRRRIAAWQRLSDAEWSVLLFGIAFTVRIALVFLTGRSATVELVEPINVACSLAENGVFGNPFLTAATGPTAHVAPLFPFLISLLYRILGNGLALGIAIHCLTAAAASAQYAALPAIANAFLNKRAIGVYAGLAGALLPFRLWVETQGAEEVAYAALALCLLFLASARLLRRPTPTWGFCILYGIGWGLAILTTPVVAPLLLCILIWWAGCRSLRQVLMRATVIAACCGAVILPWILRNYFVLGAPAFVRDNFGLELSVSNSDAADPLMQRNLYSPGFVHPFFDRAEAERMRVMGETAYYDARRQAAIYWIRRHPARFAHLTLMRVWYFWFTPTNSAVKTVFFSGLMILATGGLVTHFRRYKQVAWLFSILWIVFPLPYYLVQVNPRYRYPIDWALWLFAAHAVAMLFAWHHKRVPPATGTSGVG